MQITVRPEEPRDYRRVEELTRAAFSDPARIERSQIGCPLEHYMVHALRERDGVPELSYVAEADGVLAGHVIYSHAWVEQPDGTRVAVLNFGPLSVLPEYQRQGVGTALMRATIQRAKELGHGAILFFGRPEYYPRFGFVEAAEFGITDCNGENYSAFMAMELKPGYLEQVTGAFRESPVYNDDLNREAAREFDRRFRGEP